MTGISFFSAADKQPGRWAVYKLRRDDEARTTCPVRLRIRKVPGPKFDEISFKIYGRKRVTKNGVFEADKSKELDFFIEKASFALLEVADFPTIDIAPGDDESAAVLAAALGRPVSAGENVDVNGAWNAATKDLMFRFFRDLLFFVSNDSDQQTSMDATDEAELGKT